MWMNHTQNAVWVTNYYGLRVYDTNGDEIANAENFTPYILDPQGGKKHLAQYATIFSADTIGRYHTKSVLRTSIDNLQYSATGMNICDVIPI